MNLTIAKEQIINGLQAVQNVVSTRTTLPILSNVLLRAEGDRLEFTATDLDVTVACGVEANVKKPGASTVPVKKLFGIVRELGNTEIDIEVDDKNVCSIRSGASFYKINGLERGRVSAHAEFQGREEGDPAAGNGAEHDEENFLCNFHGRIPLRVERHFHQPQGSQDDHGGDGWQKAGAGGRGSGCV